MGAAIQVAAGAMLAGCSLPVENQNTPDRQRLYSDPATMEAALTGAVRTWINTRQAGSPTLTLNAMADSYTGAWGNFQLQLYSSEPRIAFDNDPTVPASTTIEGYWYGFYSAMSTANDLLMAIRKNGVILDPPGGSRVLTRRAETVCVMLQGVALAMIALNYDSGFVATEDTKPEAFDSLPVLSRQQLRDTALARFEEAIQLAEANGFTTPPAWLGAAGGPTYTSNQLARLMRTMGAEVVALMARSAAENAQVDWARVASWASRGISASPAFDFQFITAYEGGIYDEVKDWGNDITIMRVDTRLAHLLSPNQQQPWPEPEGSPPPVSVDRRMGDGSYGPEDNFIDMGGFAATANAGTDFAWAGEGQIFPPGRGSYHNSNIGRHRYDCATGISDPPGHCQVPLYTAALNDLLWAEGLIRSGGDKIRAAQLINKTRVGRGGLPPLTGVESPGGLLPALQYEQEIELMDLGPTVFFNRRRVDGLQPFTPRHMPIPYKELDLLRHELYTYGGQGHPDMSAPEGGGARRIRNVHDIYTEMEAERLRQARVRRRF